MNETKIEQIDSRIQELENLSRGEERVRFIDGHFIAPDFIEEYSDLKDLKDIIEKSSNNTSNIAIDDPNAYIPRVQYNDVRIRQDLLDQYIDLSSRVTLNEENILDSTEKIGDQPVEDTNFGFDEPVPSESEIALADEEIAQEENLNDENIDIENPIHPEYDGPVPSESEIALTDEEIAQEENLNDENIDIENPIHPEYDGPVTPGAEIAIVDQKNIQEENTKTNTTENKVKYIDGTNIPYPREKFEDETIEEYEDYLREHYRPYGLADDNIEYYPNTNIPKPRIPYPHEWKTMHDTDSYYNQLLHYLSDKAFDAQKETMKPKEDEPETKQEPTKDNDKHEVKGIRKATAFLKKHKKKIIVALGLTALVVACCPGVIPSIMYANSVLWHHVPALLQGALHGCNAFLSGFVGATEVASGLWSINGSLLNASAIAGNIWSALGVSALTFAGSASILATINIARKELVNKIKNLGKKKKKEKQEDEDKDKTKDKEKENDKEHEKTKDKEKDSSEKTSIIDKIKDKFSKDKDNQPSNPTSDEEIIDETQIDEKDDNISKNGESIDNEEEPKTDNVENTPDNGSSKQEDEKYDFLDEVNKKIDHYIEFMPQANAPKGYIPGLHASVPLNEANIHERIRDLNRINEIIANGQNASIINTINFDGHRIDPKDKAELQHLLKKHNVNYDIKNVDEVKDEIQIQETEENVINKDNDENIEDVKSTDERAENKHNIDTDAMAQRIADNINNPTFETSDTDKKLHESVENFETPVIKKETTDFSTFNNPEWIEKLKQERDSLLAMENSDENKNERTM